MVTATKERKQTQAPGASPPAAELRKLGFRKKKPHFDKNSSIPHAMPQRHH